MSPQPTERGNGKGNSVIFLKTQKKKQVLSKPIELHHWRFAYFAICKSKKEKEKNAEEGREEEIMVNRKHKVRW